MNQPNDILNELTELSPALAAISKVNVFSVPDGYFDHLSSILLLQTAEKEFSTVPQGYFNDLSANIMARIKQEETAIETKEDKGLSFNIGNKNVFTVPADYFEKLPDTILSRIYNESVYHETSSSSELVANIGNKNVFTVPAGYFDSVAKDITQQIAPAKVVSMNPRRNIVKYAAAAVVAGIIAMSALFIFNKTDKNTISTENLAAIEKAETIIKTNSFDKEMASLNDADIVNFLESKGQDVNAALVASLTEDEKVLPDADDYLFDENALNDILKDLDLNN